MKGIIFDFNGTLYWDSQLHYDAWIEYSKILRGTSFTKEEGRIYKEPTYIRILGFNHKGRQYLKKIKKNCPLPILTKYQAGYPMLEIESRTSLIYDQSLEYRQKTIQK